MLYVSQKFVMFMYSFCFSFIFYNDFFAYQYVVNNHKKIF